MRVILLRLSVLGRKNGYIRPLKTVFEEKDKKYELLNKRKVIANDDDVKTLFHNKIYVNPDSSVLVQKEEYRLRQKLKKIKNDESTAKWYIRSGVLYLNDEVIDRVDKKNQLF